MFAHMLDLNKKLKPSFEYLKYAKLMFYIGKKEGAYNHTYSLVPRQAEKDLPQRGLAADQSSNIGA